MSDWAERFEAIAYDPFTPGCINAHEPWVPALVMDDGEPICVDCLAERIIDAYLASIPFKPVGALAERMIKAIRQSKEGNSGT